MRLWDPVQGCPFVFSELCCQMEAVSKNVVPPVCGPLLLVPLMVKSDGEVRPSVRNYEKCPLQLLCLHFMFYFLIFEVCFFFYPIPLELSLSSIPANWSNSQHSAGVYVICFQQLPVETSEDCTGDFSRLCLTRIVYSDGNTCWTVQPALRLWQGCKNKKEIRKLSHEEGFKLAHTVPSLVNRIPQLISQWNHY